MPTGLRRRGYADGFAVGIAYAEGKCYADCKTELRRGASTLRGYAEGSPRRILRRRQNMATPRAIGRRRISLFL
jgi:hypothetical protein